MKAYREKSLSKEELTKTLRAFQASKNETKSKERDVAQAVLSQKAEQQRQLGLLDTRRSGAPQRERTDAADLLRQPQ